MIRARGIALCLALSALAAACSLFALASLRAAHAAPVSIQDDDGTAIALREPARRIIALYGAFNEILLAMGLEDRIIARTAADAEIPELAHLPGIGTHMRPSLEMVAALGPDLVLQMGGRDEALESAHALRRLGVTVAVFHVASFDELFSCISRLGGLTGSEPEAARLVGALETRLADLAATLDLPVTGDARPTVFFELRYPGLIGAGSGAMVTDIIDRAGGRNVLASPQSRERVVRLGEEELLRLDPAVYLVQRGPMNKNPVPPGERPHYAALSAVREGRTFIVDERLFSRPGPRSVDAAEALARILHPHRFSDSGVSP